MTVEELVEGLEREGFRVSIWGKNRLRLHRPPGNSQPVSRKTMDELIQNRLGVVGYLRSRAGVCVASSQSREEPQITQKKSRPLTEQQLKFIDALTYTDTVAQAGRIAGYGTRQSAHKAYRSILRRMPGFLRGLLRSWSIRAESADKGRPEGRIR
jgi:hypothetical protein